ncbi:MAG: hypothetical protein B6D61_11860 [Bacteroidetes bacterium 4484_249]|nr:MAG: hypothetical protein B6D61_11860 [Bacteroidetes bacterium 4484_249]
MRKYIFILLFLILLAFKAGDNRSQYSIPQAAWSVTAGDIDQDGDNDIVVGHNYSSQTHWSGVSFIINHGDGTLYLKDSIYLYSWQTNIYAVNVDNDSFPEIIARHFENETQYMAVLNFDQGNYITNLYSMTYGITGNTISDVNGDNYIDIVIYSNSNQFWGIMYNNGDGNFSNPEYHYVSDYHPRAISCGDLNEDGWDDIVVCGGSTEVYFSYSDGFQLLTLETDEPKDGVSIVDFNLDGENDILTFIDYPTGNVTGLVMYKNQGNNILDTLDQLYFSFGSSNYFVTDFNNDSLQDILFQLGDYSGYVIYYNQGDFQLADSQFVALPESNPPEGWRNCYCADMDGNGYKDIITVKTLYAYLPDNLEILFNDGQGHFVEDPITSIQTPPANYRGQASNLICYPNPFKDKATIEYTLGKKSMVDVSIYNMRGQKIKTLNNKILQAGKHTHTWDGTDKIGKEVNSGIYIIRLAASRQKHSCKITYMK